MSKTTEEAQETAPTLCQSIAPVVFHQDASSFSPSLLPHGGDIRPERVPVEQELLDLVHGTHPLMFALSQPFVENASVGADEWALKLERQRRHATDTRCAVPQILPLFAVPPARGADPDDLPRQKVDCLVEHRVGVAVAAQAGPRLPVPLEGAGGRPVWATEVEVGRRWQTGG